MTPKPLHQYTLHERNVICEAWRTGLHTRQELAEMFNVPRDKICQIIRKGTGKLWHRTGFKPGVRLITNEMVLEMKRLRWKEDVPAIQIADHFGVSVTSVYRYTNNRVGD